MELDEGYKNATGQEDLLFDILCRQFDQLVPPPGSVSPASTQDFGFSQDRLILLLRCCLSSVLLLKCNRLVMEKCEVLVAMLGRLCDYARRQESFANDDAGCALLVIALLEVFIENLLVHHELRRSFLRTNSAAAIIEKSFQPPGNDGDFQFIPELVACHFLLSTDNERCFDDFWNSISLSKKAVGEAPQLGLPAALKLIHMGIMSSYPDMVQAHLTSIASRCIDNHSLEQKSNLDSRCTDFHLLAFELAVHLHIKYLSALDVFGNSSVGKDEANNCAKKLPFGSYVQEVTYHKLSCRINKLLSFSQSYCLDGLTANKGDILSSSVGFIDVNQNIVSKQFAQETNSIMHSIIPSFVALVDDKSMVSEKEVKVTKDITCFAASLQLMCSSLLQVLCYIRQTGVSASRGELSQAVKCEEFISISQIIRCIGKHKVDLVVQKKLLDLMGEKFDRERVWTPFFMHFASIFCNSLSTRLGCLRKGSLLMMMAIMDLMRVGEESLDIFHFSFRSLNEYALYPFQEERNTPKGLIYRSSTASIVSVFKNIQQVYLKDSIKCINFQESSPEADESSSFEPGTCNGRAFFNCLENPSQYDDLVDFVTCKEGKDYSGWLKQNRKFRCFKNERRIMWKLSSKRRGKFR